MTSYKNVVKFDYTQNPSDVVALKEYILFNDGDDKKYALLKFINNLNQKLYALQFEAHQYDGDGNLIAKTVAMYDKFTAEEGETFVPKAKLKLSANCEKITLKLLSAHFDRVKWENGVFTDNIYTFERYVGDEKSDAKIRAKKNKNQEPKIYTPVNTVAQKRSRHKPVNFHSWDVTRENLARFPKVFGVFVLILVVAFVIATSVLVKNEMIEEKRFSIGDYDVRMYSDTEVVITGYCGTEKEVVIPAKLDDYYVVKIDGGAFRYSNIQTVKFTATDFDLTISPGAFYKCRKLTEVTSTGKCTVDVLGYAFDGCENIERINMPTANVADYGFNGSFSVRRITIMSGDEEMIFGEKTDK